MGDSLRGDSELNSLDETRSPSLREDILSSQQRKRKQSVYCQHQSIKPIDRQSVVAAQKRISLNPNYVNKQCKNIKRLDKEKLTRACHRPVTVPLVNIIGKIPEYVDMSELQGLRREFAELRKDYHKIVENKRYEIHRRHVELMEINKIASDRLRQRFIKTLKAYGISTNVISDVLAELQ